MGLATRKRTSIANLRGDMMDFEHRASGTMELATDVIRAIAPHVTFRQWCESLTEERVDEKGVRRPALKVDNKPFKLSDRPAMAWIYDQVPSTREEAFRMTLTLMKCAQVGFTVMEMLVAIYFALKFEPLAIGMFLPDMNLARGKSSLRFMPIVRTVPEAYDRLTADDPTTKERSKGEGNVILLRVQAGAASSDGRGVVR